MRPRILQRSFRGHVVRILVATARQRAFDLALDLLLDLYTIPSVVRYWLTPKRTLAFFHLLCSPGLPVYSHFLFILVSHLSSK